MPEIEWLKAPDPEFDFLDFEEAERLLAGSRRDRKRFSANERRFPRRTGRLRGEERRGDISRE